MQEGKVRNRKVNRWIFKKKVRKAHTRDEIRLPSQAEYSRGFSKHIYQKQKDDSGSQQSFYDGVGHSDW